MDNDTAAKPDDTAAQAHEPSGCTPGEWSVYRDHLLVIVNANGSSIGDACPGDPFIGEAEAQANARLFAASKALFVALQAVLPHALVMINEHHPATKLARAALAKATGSVS